MEGKRTGGGLKEKKEVEGREDDEMEEETDEEMEWADI